MSACLCGFMSKHMCVCVCVRLQVCVGVKKISHLREGDEGWASGVFVFVSPVLMTSAAQAPVSVCLLGGGGGGYVSKL